MKGMDKSMNKPLPTIKLHVKKMVLPETKGNSQYRLLGNPQKIKESLDKMKS